MVVRDNDYWIKKYGFTESKVILERIDKIKQKEGIFKNFNFFKSFFFIKNLI